MLSIYIIVKSMGTSTIYSVYVAHHTAHSKKFPGRDMPMTVLIKFIDNGLRCLLVYHRQNRASRGVKRWPHLVRPSKITSYTSNSHHHRPPPTTDHNHSTPQYFNHSCINHNDEDYVRNFVTTPYLVGCHERGTTRWHRYQRVRTFTKTTPRFDMLRNLPGLWW